jgi:hypothetical protein
MAGFPWGSPFDFVFDAVAADDDISSIVVIARDMLMVTFRESLIVDSAYLDAASYTITAVTDGAAAIQITNVLMQFDEDENPKFSSTPYLFLQVTQPTLGAVYNIDIVTPTSLRYVDGTSPAAAVTVRKFQSRYTKTDQTLRSIPKHFDKRVTAEIRTLLTAISLSDDLIGGSRRDDFDA